MRRAIMAYGAVVLLSLLHTACLLSRRPLDAEPKVARNALLLGKWSCRVPYLEAKTGQLESRRTVTVAADGKYGYTIEFEDTTYRAFGSATPAGEVLNVTPENKDRPTPSGWLFAKYTLSTANRGTVGLLHEELMGGSAGEGWSEGAALTEDSPEVLRAKMERHRGSPKLFEAFLDCERHAVPAS